MKIDILNINDENRIFFNIYGKGHAYLVTVFNPVRKMKYGLIEDLFVEEEYRNKGYGKKIINVILGWAKDNGYYKVIATSRFERENVHKFYEDLGLKKWGYEFRIDL